MLGHFIDAEFFLDGDAAGLAELAGARWVGEELAKSGGERVNVVRFAEEAAAGGGDEFRKCSVSRLDDGNGAGERFEDVESERFGVERGDGENVEALEESDLGVALQVRKKLDAVAEPSAQCGDEWFVGVGHRAGDAEAGVEDVQLGECVGEEAETFAVRHQREKTDGRHGGRRGGRREFFERDAVVDDVDAVGGEVQTRAHQVGEVTADGDETVHVGATLGEQLPGLGAIRFGEAVEKGVFTLHRGDERSTEFFFQAARHAGEEGVGEADNIELRLGAEPVEKTVEFGRCAGEHGDGGFAEVLGGGHVGEAGTKPEHGGGTESTVKPARDAEFSFKEDADAAEEDRRGAGFEWCLGDNRQVERHHEDVVAASAEGMDERVVAKAAAAVVIAGAGGELEDAHASSLAQRLCLHQVGCTYLDDIYEKPSAESERAVT